MTRLRLAFPALILALSAVLSGCGGGSSNNSGGGGSTGPASTTTTLTVSPNPAAPGATVTLTATVSTTGTPTGSITFYDGATSLGSATLSGTTASITVSTFTAGSTHSLSASYAGDSGHSASTSATVSFSVSALTATTIVLTASPNPALPGAAVTLTATVTPAATGTVTFYDGVTSLGTAPLNSGVATITLSTLSTASHSLTAAYSGDSTHATSTSTAVLLSVALAPTTTTLTASPNPGTPGAAITLTATVTSTSSPTGTVTFYDGATSLGTGTVNGSGVATLSVSTFAASSSHSVSATYGGDSTHATSTSATVSVTVSALLTTTTTLTASPNPSTPGAAVTLTATVTSTNSVTGTVTFYDGSTSLGTATVTSGIATTSVSTFAANTTHSLTATYSGDTSHATSTSSPVSLVVNGLATTTTTLTASPNPAPAGSTISLSATVASTSTATGTVTFYDGSTSLGTASLSNGIATTTVTTFAAGTSHSLTAAYGGDSTHATSTSTAVSLVINGSAPIDAHATFSFTTPNQTINGFGAAEAFYLNYLDSHPYSNEIYSALFDPTAGLGLTYLRLQNLYNGSPSGFDPDTPKIVTSANQAHGTPLTLMMSSWSPTANLKSNNSTNGCTVSGGVCVAATLIKVSGAYDYADYATYWYNSLVAYSALGVNPSFISIQNEPDFTATYTGCRFNPTEATYNGANFAGYGLAFDAVYKKIQSLTTPPTMFGPETLSVGQSFLDMAAQIPASETTTYAHHLYNVSSGTDPKTAPGGNPDTGVAALKAMNAAYPNATKFETEYYDTPGFYNAWSIHNALVDGNDNAYVFWQAAWPSTLETGNDQAADQAGLIYVDNPFNSQSTWAFAHGWTYNDSYYAMKHYSYYVRPGYVRYNATVDNTDERVSVYQSPDKKTTIIVVLNVSTTVTDGLSLDLSSIPYANSAMYRSTFSQAIKTGERWASLGTYTAPTGSGTSNNSGGISLPPQSAVTIVLTN